MSSRKRVPPKGDGSATALCSATQKIYPVEILCEKALKNNKRHLFSTYLENVSSTSALPFRLYGPYPLWLIAEVPDPWAGDRHNSLLNHAKINQLYFDYLGSVLALR
jgi:hypothetical protein